MGVDKYTNFYERVSASANSLKNIDKKETIKVISHLDADGIAAAAIMTRFLNLDKRKFSVTMIRALDEQTLKKALTEKTNVFFFLDIGSGQLNLITNILSGKTVFILDHHLIDKDATLIDKVNILNPHMFGIDGDKEISGSGLTFLFCRELNKSIDSLAHLAIIGAIGDTQENNGFKKLNNDILTVAVENKKLNVCEDLRLFGIHSRPIHKVLQENPDFYIPNVTGSEDGAIEFLEKIDVKPKIAGRWRKISHLTKDEKTRLTNELTNRVVVREDKELVGNVYLLPSEEDESPTKDAKEFSTLLNACCYVGKASQGIGACLNDHELKTRALNNLSKYKSELCSAMKWFDKNKDSKCVLKGKNYVIINAENNIPESVIGTIMTIFSKSNMFEPNTVIVGLAQGSDTATKVSMRVSGSGTDFKVNLYDVLNDVMNGIAGEFGGHKRAAGAVIPTKLEPEFIDKLKKRIAEI